MQGRVWRTGRIWESALAALAAFAYIAFDPRFLEDGDSYWHVAAGEWMLGHQQVARTDPFSFTFLGKDWHAHEWLAEVIFALAYRVSGWAAVLVVTALAVAVAVGLVHRVARNNLPWFWAAGAALLALACMAPNLLARPQTLGIAMLAIWTKVLLDAHARGRTPSLWWLLLIVVWSNLHGSVLFGLFLTAVFALDALNERTAAWPDVVRQWALFGLGAGLAAAFTPRGFDGLLFLVNLTRMESLAAIVEWMPPQFGRPNGLVLLLFGGLLALLYTGTRVPLVRALLLLTILYLTLNHQRHQVLLAIVGTMIVCEALGHARQKDVRPEQGTGWPVLGLGLFGLALATIRLFIPVSIAESERSPQSALAAVPGDLRQQPVLNAYGAGGFLIANGVRPFIDGRTDLYGDGFFRSYADIVANKGGALDSALASYAIGWTLLEVGSPAAQALDRKPGWQRLHADRYVVVHRRTQ